MNGKAIVAVLTLSAALAGGALYYLQVYGYYHEVQAEAEPVSLVLLADNLPEPILAENFQAIDADSSPIRYRACFTTPMTAAVLSETYVMVDNPKPLNAPGWFDCFNAESIGAALEAGSALAFLGQKNVHFGVDQIVAITDDGRGYIWHQLNECGEKSYDGTVVGEACPDRPGVSQ
ncbi:MAG: DUF6446 family protein [Pseudomonadota bacterium]|nr:DUF6446 family protein [Pseudomonadota bacterium]